MIISILSFYVVHWVFAVTRVHHEHTYEAGYQCSQREWWHSSSHRQQMGILYACPFYFFHTFIISVISFDMSLSVVFKEIISFSMLSIVKNIYERSITENSKSLRSSKWVRNYTEDTYVFNISQASLQKT